LGSPAALAQVSRPASVTCAVSDRWSAKILNERGLSVTPCRAGEDAPLAGPAGQPGTVNGRRLASGPWQSPSFGPPTYRLRQLALERSHHAQYRSDRLCPVVAGGLRQIRQGGCGLAECGVHEPVTHCGSRRIPGRLALAPVAGSVRSWRFRPLGAA